LRELDFKHNYEEKLKIIEQAEALQEHPNVLKASRDLNTLHQLWKNDLGPVAKEHREALWTRFQNASKIIQSKRQAYQKDMVGAMKENLSKKVALLTEMKTLGDSPLESHKAWQNAIKKFNELREQFKAIGYVPAKDSKSTWQEFRDLGRKFMNAKNVFYKEQKQEYNRNIEDKKALITRSVEIIESENWETRAQEMKDIQKEWKSIGFVPRKLDNKLWKEFSDQHKLFFDRLKSGYQRLSPEQEAYQNQKITFIEKVKATEFSEDPEVLTQEYTQTWNDWNALGYSGSTSDEKMGHSFSNALISSVKKVKLDKKTMNKILTNLNTLLLQGDPKRLQKELQSARSTVSSLQAELTQLQNNLEFFSHSSSENPLFKNVEKQIQVCQNKIDKANEDYIRLKQIRNAQKKKAKEAEDVANASENQEDLKPSKD
jgi:hypothetical protein